MDTKFLSYYTKTEVNNSLALKQATITGSASTITTTNLTASRALVIHASGKVAVSSTTDAQISYLSGVNGNIQPQIDGKTSNDNRRCFYNNIG